MKRKAEVSLGSGTNWVRGDKIGQGGFASVFVAHSSKNPNNTQQENNDVPEMMAVKSAKLKYAATVRHELVVFNELTHNGGCCPFVIDYFGEDLTVSDDREVVYNLGLELAWGSLAKYIGISAANHRHGLSEYEARRYTADILRGLKHIHRSGYVHCDLKPDNILLVRNDEGFPLIAKIADLGLSKKNEVKEGWRGTPPYLAPETIREDEQEYASDVWALGLIALEMLTGEQAKSHLSRFYSRDDDESDDAIYIVDGLKNVKPEILGTLSKDAKEFLGFCLAEDTEERWTVDELLDHPFVYDLVKPRKLPRLV